MSRVRGWCVSPRIVPFAIDIFIICVTSRYLAYSRASASSMSAGVCLSVCVCMCMCELCVSPTREKEKTRRTAGSELASVILSRINKMTYAARGCSMTFQSGARDDSKRGDVSARNSENRHFFEGEKEKKGKGRNTKIPDDGSCGRNHRRRTRAYCAFVITI